MTERLADISARIDGIRQLGAVVNAMKGIAAARATCARAQVAGRRQLCRDHRRGHVAHGLEPGTTGPTGQMRRTGKTGLLVFCAEQGFAGAFSERVLDSVGAELDAGTCS